MTDPRTPEQAAATEQRLIVKLTEILVQTERQLLETREELAVTKLKLGERQAREGL